jgi:hypothetical protein
VHIHENFENYVVLEMVVVKFVYYCYYSLNWNLDDLSNQGYMFASMGYDLAFGNCLKHWLVHGDIPWKKAKLDNHLLYVHSFHRFDTMSWTNFNWPLFLNSSASTFLAKDANLAWRSWFSLRLYKPPLDVWD